MNNGPQGSGNRWWEIRGAGQPDEDEGGDGELMTDSRGRSRPERSLSVGADLAEEPRHPSRAFLWPIVSVVVAVGLILSVVYVVSTGKPQPERALAAPPAPRSSAPGNPEAKPDADATPDGGSRPVQPGPLPAAGDDTRRPPARPPADAPPSPAVLPASPAGNPGPVVTPPPSGSSGGTGGDAGKPPTGTPTPSTMAPPQALPVKLDSLDGPAPATPRSQRVGAPVPGTGGCGKSTSPYYNYACAITRDAPYYLATMTDPGGTLHTDKTGFLCQLRGSKYSVAKRVNHWWARLWVSVNDVAVWVPLVFLKGAPSGDKPVPGLPLCDSASESAR